MHLTFFCDKLDFILLLLLLRKFFHSCTAHSARLSFQIQVRYLKVLILQRVEWNIRKILYQREAYTMGIIVLGLGMKQAVMDQHSSHVAFYGNLLWDW